MKAAKIKQHFQKYIDSLEDLSPFRNHSESVAALFGSDEIKVDMTNSRVRLPEFGWFSVDKVLPKKRIAWAAVMQEGGNHYITLAENMNPFGGEAREILPVVDETILAMPFVNSDRIKDKMIAT